MGTSSGGGEAAFPLHATANTGGGGRRDRTLYGDPPPPLMDFGPEVPDHGRRRHPKEFLLDLVK